MILQLRGRIYAVHEQDNEAMAVLRASSEIYESIDNVFEASKTKTIQASILMRYGYFVEALQYLSEALVVARRYKDVDQIISCLRLMSMAYEQMGSREEALQAFLELEEMYSRFEIEDPVTLANVKSSISRLK